MNEVGGIARETALHVAVQPGTWSNSHVSAERYAGPEATCRNLSSYWIPLESGTTRSKLCRLFWYLGSNVFRFEGDSETCHSDSGHRCGHLARTSTQIRTCKMPPAGMLKHDLVNLSDTSCASKSTVSVSNSFQVFNGFQSFSSLKPNIKEPNKTIGSGRCSGQAPLHRAARDGTVGCIQTLLAAAALVDPRLEFSVCKHIHYRSSMENKMIYNHV